MKLLAVLLILSLSVATGQVCRDVKSNKDCRFWKRNYYCFRSSIYYQFMTTNCRLTCGFCRVLPRVVTTRKPYDKKTCMDRQPLFTCNVWKQVGHCEKSRTSAQWYRHMKANCAFTCGFCGNPDCKNKHRKCNYWSKNYHCSRTSRYYQYMTQNCRKACGFCKTTKVTTTTTTTVPPPPVKTTKRTVPPPPVTSTNTQPPPVTSTTVPPPPFTSTTALPPPITTTLVTTPTEEITTAPTPPITSTVVTTPPDETTTAPPPPVTTAAPPPPARTTTPKSVATTKPTNTSIFPAECGINKRNEIGSFIVDGVTAQPNVWPWQAGLFVHGEFNCGATLVHPRFLVTAGHCMEDLKPENINVRLGDHKRDTHEGPEQEFEIDGFLIHEKFNSIMSLDNDIALVMLSKPAVLNKNVNVACLPEQDEVVDNTTKCYVSGWGRMEANGATVNVLQEAKLPVVTSETCGEKNKDSNGNSKITSNMMCAGNKDVTTSGCRGDSGGPFVCKSKSNKWVLQGAVSWGSNKCDTRNKYTVFAKVSKYANWIKNNIKDAIGGI